MSQATTIETPSGSTRGRVARAKLATLIQRQGALLMLIIVCAYGVISYDQFLNPNFIVVNLLRQNSMLGFVALGMTFVILTGGIDLSVGALAAVAGVIAANLAGRGLLIAVLAAVAFTTLLGLTNGFLIAKARIQPFIVTLAMMIAARGLALVYTGERPVSVSHMTEGFNWLGTGWLGPVPVPVVLLVAAYAAGWLVLNHTRFGRHVYALGDNEEAARLMGLNVTRATLGVYALSGALAGLAGATLASRLGAGQPDAAVGWELDAIASVVVGGTLLTGGQGSVGSTLVGLLLLGVIMNLINLDGRFNPWWQTVIRGVFLLVVVVVQNLLSRRK